MQNMFNVPRFRGRSLCQIHPIDSHTPLPKREFNRIQRVRNVFKQRNNKQFGTAHFKINQFGRIEGTGGAPLTNF